MQASLTADSPTATPPSPLNPAQQAAAAHGETLAEGGVRAGPLLIIAGAGTGKTQTLSHRAAHLVLNGVDPARLLLLTFSRRAAEEMTRRAQSIITATLRERGETAPQLRLPWSGTFHGIGNRLLREYHANLGLDAQFSILDRGDAADLMDLCRRALDLPTGQRRFPRKDTCLGIYSRTVNTRLPLADVLSRHYPWCAEWADTLKSLFAAYVAHKQRTASLDYDDLLLYWCHAMQVPELAADMSQRFDHVLVDEYQDTNVVQADILRGLRPDGAGLTVVGDDAQSIYSFRAASVENILNFPEQFDPPARVVTLEQNYRSTQPVLDAANAIIAQASRGYDKHLVSACGQGPRPRFVTLEDDQSQALYTVETVLDNREAGQRLRDQAVLFRASHHADGLEVELVRRNIPYRKFGGLKFLEAAHVKDLLSILRWADNPKNQIAAFRCCQLVPGLGPKAAEAAMQWLTAHNHDLTQLARFKPRARAADLDCWRALGELLGRLSDPSCDWNGQIQVARQWYEPLLPLRYEAADVRAADLAQLEQISLRFSDRGSFLTELALDPPAATGDEAGDPLLDEDFLILSTIHSAKGQEWDSVFVLNVADGNLPSEFGTGQQETIEEERRLTYVAMTRARTQLHLLAPLKYYVPEQPRYGNRHVYGARSRFFPDAVMPHFESVTYPQADPATAPNSRCTAQVDVAAAMRDMWS
ncbi:ATP-dependent helicase [Abyssibacter profundi]|uniref:DNA 3'-5' helicase n=1 Tax=Abyssibacter profundi TaxID=2182787 RepID=A0A383XRI7_9GAMM|nr:ATP-dependent helicase [Abyssibacter profundi]PWN55241.1 ATP-dependent DNA helicase [Abyssibacter profundi]